MQDKWPDVQEKLDLVKAWAMDGLYEKDICKNLGVSKQTFNKYKKEHLDLVEALKTGKERADYTVQNATFKLACGFKVKVKKNIKLKKSYYDGSGRKVEEEYLKEVEDEQYVPPNATTQIFWLKRRIPDKWGDLPKHPDYEEDNKVVLLPSVDFSEANNDE